MANDSGWSQPACGQVLCELSPAALPRHGAPAASCPLPPCCPRRPANPHPGSWKGTSQGFILLKKNSAFGVLRKAPGLGYVPVLSVQREPGKNIPACHSAMSLHGELKSVLPNVSSRPFLWVKLTIF